MLGRVSRSRAMPVGDRRSMSVVAYCRVREKNKWQRTLFAAGVTGGKV